jgi:carbonic anhydrase/acetyltransferase-like protein (isoleucine patch superfamily)
LVGPNAHVSGATIGHRVFIATGAAVFNGGVLKEGTVVAINAVVHIGTHCPAGMLVPIGHIAFGEPARITVLHS